MPARVARPLLVQRSWLNILTTVVRAPIWVAQAELLQRTILAIGARDRTRRQRCFVDDEHHTVLEAKNR